MGAVSCFLAVGTFGEVLIWSKKANTANPFLGHFKGVMTGFWENLRESAEGTIR